MVSLQTFCLLLLGAIFFCLIGLLFVMISNFVGFGGCPFIVFLLFWLVYSLSVRLFSEERMSMDSSEWGGLRESRGRRSWDQNILHDKKKGFSIKKKE